MRGRLCQLTPPRTSSELVDTPCDAFQGLVPEARESVYHTSSTLQAKARPKTASNPPPIFLANPRAGNPARQSLSLGKVVVPCIEKFLPVARILNIMGNFSGTEARICSFIFSRECNDPELLSPWVGGICVPGGGWAAQCGTLNNFLLIFAYLLYSALSPLKTGPSYGYFHSYSSSCVPPQLGNVCFRPHRIDDDVRALP